MSDNPAPRAEGASPDKPVTWAEMLGTLAAESERADISRARLIADLAGEQLTPIECTTLRSAIAHQARRVEVFSAVWRAIWALRSDDKLLRRLREISAAERGGDLDADQTRYD
ncbi:hypothetical protein [Bradyrhizobium sp. SZCCHNR1020]|uniref:hypothetical protein n=1 Tax=Bradyrhizobium sp. SZCCHNR1020 TaxID=3057343 RepID=UPI002916E02C|nr:hypothetical protein [Bradyrhizobium sp. SZCCHNR1020]